MSQKSLEMSDVARQLWVSLDVCQLLRLPRPQAEAGRGGRGRERKRRSKCSSRHTLTQGSLTSPGAW